MQRIIKTEKIPIKLWLEEIEEDTLQQAKNLANHPKAFHHIAIMPDAHLGYGMPIGGVMATKDVIIPNAVGVDIGCGMCALKTELESISEDDLKKIMGDIRNNVPTGFSKHKSKQAQNLLPDNPPEGIISDEYDYARKQIGTLGGGNHFIDILKGSDGYIWIMVHSGSRNLGYKVAKQNNNIAKKLSNKLFPDIPHKWDLAPLPTDSEEGQRYLEEMQYCVDFAFANRRVMMSRVAEIFHKYIPETFPETTEEHIEHFMINIAHNYARKETHFNQEVYVHRKGATSARKAETGIIPGSQGSNSFIVEGKGNKESFCSCSHGAGRVMGRKEAVRKLDLKKAQKDLEEKGILHGIRGKSDLDEAPEAYKDIHQVMKYQEDLVEIKVELKPIGVVKG